MKNNIMNENLVLSLTGLSLDELLQLFFLNIKNLDFYDSVAMAIEAESPGYLLKNIKSFKGDRLHAAIFGMSVCKKSINEIEQIEKLLKYKDQMAVSHTIDTLRSLKSKKSWHKIKPLLKHKSPYVVGACLRFASFRLGKKAIPLICSFKDDKRYIVRMNVVDELEEFYDPVVIPYLKPMLKDKNKVIRKITKDAIKVLKEYE